MSETLIVIGEYKGDSIFGKLLKKHIRKNDIPDITFYEVQNKYKGTSGTSEENRVSQEEVYDAIVELQPKLTIDVHSGEGSNKVYRALIGTNTEYDKLKTMESYITSPLIDEESISVIPIKDVEGFAFPEVVTDKSRPFIDLTIIVDSDVYERPYERPIEFTANLIRRLSKRY